MSALRRDLGKLDSYAALIGILVGAGIYQATKDAYLVTGPSLVLGYAVLAPVILCIAIPYAAFQSAPSASGPGGDYAHLRAVFGPGVITFLAAWLKIISYLGALVYLAVAMADYLIKAVVIAGLVAIDPAESAGLQKPVATVCMVGFFLVHRAGVRWFGRLQVWMCLFLGVSILVLVLPGMFAVESANLTPWFREGNSEFFRSLPILFFAYAGFEALSHTSGEVRNSHVSLPGVYLRGVLVTTVIFFLMSGVVVGVLAPAEMKASSAPMADAAHKFLPWGAALIVAIGGVFATATSVNATLIVPPRLAITLAEDGSLPRGLARIHPRTGTPARGLGWTLLIALALMWTGQHGFALSIAVIALMTVYFLHTLAFLLVGRRAPELAAEMNLRIAPGLQRLTAVVALLTLAVLIGSSVTGDVEIVLAWLAGEETGERSGRATVLLITWSILGAVLFGVARFVRSRHTTVDDDGES